MNLAEHTPAQHTRVYKACWSCRQRKVRCDLGPVDNPHSPPCARCRRENRPCRFHPPDDQSHSTQRSNQQNANTENFENRFSKKRHIDHETTSLQPHTVVSALNGQHSTETSAEDSENLRGHDQTSQLSDESDEHENTVRVSDDTLNTLYRDADQVRRSSLLQDAQRPRDDQNSFAPTNASATGINSEISSSVRSVWESVVFIQDGLFTVDEALTYVEFFRDHMEPYSPIKCGHLLDSVGHVELLQEEPVLAVTILVIASRSCVLPGAGSSTRRFMIHERLWTALQTMVTRMFWAQDEYPTSKSPNRIRTLGTCEALLLLSDWNPRSLHFPAGRSGMSILVPGKREPRTNEYQSQSPQAWMEWSWRSDHLNWFLLWTAFALANDLGVFEKPPNVYSTGKSITAQPERSRLTLIRALISIYFLQISTRIGARPPAFENLEILASSAAADTTGLWLQLSILERQLEDDLFQSRRHTREIIKTDLYIGVVYTHQVKISKWQQKFEATPVPESMQCILKIDLAGIRTRMYSIGLQAAKSSKLSGMSSLTHCDQDFVSQMLAEARSLLSIVTVDLHPKGRMSYVPVRVYPRILSAVMYLLKAIKIMDSPDETKTSCDLVEEVGNALKNSGSDDANLSARWGELIIALSHRERQLLLERGQSRGLDISSVAAPDLSQSSSQLPLMSDSATTSSDEEFLSLYDPQTWVSFDLGTNIDMFNVNPPHFEPDFIWA